MNDIPENRQAVKDAARESRESTTGPLDGSTSGTIGGGGPETGGPAPRPQPGEPPVRPENAASGRMAPDPLAAANQPDPTRAERTDAAREEAAREGGGAPSERNTSNEDR
jgi:hypothetical protein